MSEQVFTNCTVGGPVSVHVKDGVITRVRPLAVDKNDLKPWTIEARGRKFSPHKKVTVAPFTLAERQRVYAEDRIKYPMKRIDFDPKGERHTENRGKSGYVRISWEEALDIISSEMKRIRSNYGPEAITAISGSHHNWGLVGYKFGPFSRFFNTLGFTAIFDNPDSWEGFHWGAIHTWGFFWRLGAPEQYDLLADILKNTDTVVYWSSDPDTTRTYTAQESCLWRLWLKEAGIKQIFVDPFCNHTAGILGDKWLAPRPGTDTALAEALAYVWIKEGTYDKDYVSKRTLGFEQFKDHLLGKEDGIERTPKWAEELTGIPARTITALARQWAGGRTMLSCGCRAGWGGAGRQAYGHEWGRLMVLLQAMQGLGKPGVNMWAGCQGAPMDTVHYFPGYADPDGGIARSSAASYIPVNPVKQRLYRILFPEAILNPPIKWLGEGFCGQSIEQQFIPYEYPMKGHSEVKMFYRYGSGFMGTMTETNKWVQAYQSPKLEFVVNQDCWWGGESYFADIVLPACTNLERDDISEWSLAGGYSKHGSYGCNYRVIVYQQKCVEPLGESKTDYEIFRLLAARLGIEKEYTDGGKTEADWIKGMYDISDAPKLIPWEDLKKKGYLIIPVPEKYEPTPALRWFAEGRECDTPDPLNPKRGTEKAKELSTYSGKLEFVSQSLLQQFPDDEERPPVPRYIPSWEGHTSELAKKYPLQIISPHPRFSFHTHHDKHCEWLGDIPDHRILKDSYYYQTVRIHPSDAELRGINDGDIVRLYNDRGKVLGVARLTERCRPGLLHSYCSSGKYDPLEPGKAGTPDRGGCINLLSSIRTLSKNAPGMAPNSCLVEIEKWEA